MTQRDQQLFRPEYIKVRSQDAMDTMSVNPSRAIKIAAVLSVLTSIALLIVLANLPYTRTTTMLGQLSRNSGIFVVQSSLKNPAQVMEMLVSEGDKIHPGTELLRLRSHERNLQREDSIHGNFLAIHHDATGFSEEHLLLVSIRAGEITDILATTGQQVLPGQPLLAARQDKEGLFVTIYVPSRALRGFAENKQVNIRLDAFPPQQYGALKGVIRKVADVSLSPYQVAEKLGTAPPPEPMFRVDIEIPEDQHILKLAGNSLKSGMKVEIDVPMESGTMLSWLFRRGAP